MWPDLLNEHIALVTSNYVMWETMSLLQKRLGFDAANVWYRDVLGVLDVLWVDKGAHQRAFELWQNLGRSRMSLVDCTSFVTMYQHDIEHAFCFKPHFKKHGFDLLAGNAGIGINH